MWCCAVLCYAMLSSVQCTVDNNRAWCTFTIIICCGFSFLFPILFSFHSFMQQLAVPTMRFRTGNSFFGMNESDMCVGCIDIIHVEMQVFTLALPQILAYKFDSTLTHWPQFFLIALCDRALYTMNIAHCTRFVCTFICVYMQYMQCFVSLIKLLA